MSKARILIADDDERLVVALNERLTAMGHEVIVANDAYYATASVQRERPDLLILDIHMPAGDGFSVQHRLNNMSELKHVPVIYVTGDTSDEAGQYARNLGACAVIHKPFHFEDLAAAIDKALVPKAA